MKTSPQLWDIVLSTQPLPFFLVTLRWLCLSAVSLIIFSLVRELWLVLLSDDINVHLFACWCPCLCPYFSSGFQAFVPFCILNTENILCLKPNESSLPWCWVSSEINSAGKPLWGSSWCPSLGTPWSQWKRSCQSKLCICQLSLNSSAFSPPYLSLAIELQLCLSCLLPFSTIHFPFIPLCEQTSTHSL